MLSIPSHYYKNRIKTFILKDDWSIDSRILLISCFVNIVIFCVLVAITTISIPNQSTQLTIKKQTLHISKELLEKIALSKKEYIEISNSLKKDDLASKNTLENNSTTSITSNEFHNEAYSNKSNYLPAVVSVNKRNKGVQIQGKPLSLSDSPFSNKMVTNSGFATANTSNSNISNATIANSTIANANTNPSNNIVQNGISVVSNGSNSVSDHKNETFDSQNSAKENSLQEKTLETRPPRIISRVKPEYPMLAKSQKITGNVRVEITIKSDGSVEDVSVIQTSSLLLNEAAVNAAKKMKYEPALLNGAAVRGKLIQVFDFGLK